MHHQNLHFSTRRSSDLGNINCNYPVTRRSSSRPERIDVSKTIALYSAYMPAKLSGLHYKFIRFCTNLFNQGHRSEEHTSELQSLRHLVCRLLLEKKKKQ